MPAKIGIISSREAFTTALIEALNRRPGLEAEWCRVTEACLDRPNPYAVIIDRLSHCFEFYRPYLKHAVMSGTYVINNPFWFLADDKFFNYTLATRLGVNIPRTVLLPNREYDERVLTPDDLHNLTYPLDWQGIVEHIGFPAILKPYDGYGWREVHRVENLGELMSIYNQSMMDVMMLQEFIQFEHYVRCFVIGGRWVLPIRYDPVARRYIVDHNHLTPELGQKIVTDSLTLCRALGYEINTVEFAIRDGVPYAIDFMNPVPDAKPEVITAPYFSWVVSRVCDLVEERVASGARSNFRMSTDMAEPVGQLEVSFDEEPAPTRRRFAVLS